MTDIAWHHADDVAIEPNEEYLVRTNGWEWNDTHLFVWPGVMVSKRMEPQIIRGRPQWLAKINNPKQAE